jgi:hypothetical protein
MKLEQWPSKREENDKGGTISMYEDVNGVLSTNRDVPELFLIHFLNSFV